MSDPAPGTVASRTLRGIAWAYGSYMGERVVVLITTAVLARLLVPAEFGRVALALVFITLLETLADLGLSQSLVVAPDDELDERADTAWLASVGLGVGAFALLAALAPALAAAFDQDDLHGVLTVLGVIFIVRSLASVHYALAQRALDFRSRTAAELADVAVRGTVSVGLALADASVWSLVIGYVAGEVARAAVLWLMVSWRPRRRFVRDRLRGMLAFGGALSAVDVVAALLHEVDYLFVGRVLGAEALGLYTLGFDLPELAIVNLSVVAGRVLFPAFAAVDRADLGRAFVRSTHYTLMICLPLAVGLAVAAGPLVQVVFGSRWLDAVPVMRVLTIYALAVTIGIPAGTAYKATGRAGVLLRLAIPRAVLLITALAIFTDDGIVAVATSHAVVASAFSVLGIGLATHLLDVRLAELWGAARAPVAGAAVAGVAALLVERSIEEPLLVLLLGGIAGLSAYGGVLWLLARSSLLDLRALARRPPSTAPHDPHMSDDDPVTPATPADTDLG